MRLLQKVHKLEAEKDVLVISACPSFCPKTSLPNLINRFQWHLI